MARINKKFSFLVTREINDKFLRLAEKSKCSNHSELKRALFVWALDEFEKKLLEGFIPQFKKIERISFIENTKEEKD